MRFAVAHKSASYAMIACALLAMIGGGGVGPLPSVLGSLALIGSWWWESPRVRVERWTLAWNIASLAVMAYVVLTAAATGDFVAAGAEFLIWLAVAKAYNRRSSRDWLQLYLLSFLMLVAGSVLNADLAYGVAFLGFVILSTWALILFHLRREMEDNLVLRHGDDGSERVEVQRVLDSRRVVGMPFFAGTGAISIVVFAASAATFLAIPRIGAGMFFKSRSGVTMAGFSDNGVKLGGHGTIKGDTTVVMRVEIDERYGGRKAAPIHWRGVAYDRYQLGEWTRSRDAPSTNYRLSGRPGREVRDLVEVRASQGPLVRQDIWLEPLDSDVLFAASMPSRFDIPLPLRPPRRSQDGQSGEVRFPHTDKIHYQAWSQLEPPDPDRLRQANGRIPLGFSVYLQLPPEITPRTRELAAQLTAGHANAFDKATAIAHWLTDNLTYTLTLADPGSQEPVDFFLFDRKRGHCEFFASAFAVLARAAGIPTRNVNGFYGGEWNEFDGYVAVRAGDAHSWAEAYIPGAGWVTFDPTPSSQVDRLGRGATGRLARLSRWLDTLRFQWTKWVIEYDLHSQVSLFRGIGKAFKSVGRSVKSAASQAKAWLASNWLWFVVIASCVAAIVVARRRKAGRDPWSFGWRRPPRAPTSPIAKAYARASRHLESLGLPRDRSLTPRERARAWTASNGAGAAPLAELTEILYQSEFGGHDASLLIARATTLADEILAARPHRP